MRLEGNRKEDLRQRLLGIGFDEVRFANLEPLSDGRLREWLDRGYHADMRWLENSIEKRLNPEMVLEDACSAIMFGINYLPDDEPALSQERWAKYSLYSDYHDTVLKGLKEAGKVMESSLGIGSKDYRYYVDTGPVLERGWAAASGMGWQGKNAMLLSRSHGNWLFLATMLVKLEIEPDAPVKKSADRMKGSLPELGLLCGKCERCIDACPTNAIVAPGVLDSNLCISYQTIENKGIIPRSIRPLMGTRIFGCDICLDVCPWNRFAQSGKQMLLAKRYRIAELSLLDLLSMDGVAFRETFRGTAIKRLKRRGLLRNACVAAGNLNNSDEWRDTKLTREAFLQLVADRLLHLAGGDEPLARPHAIWALHRLKGEEAKELLESLRKDEADPHAIEEYEWWEESYSRSR